MADGVETQMKALIEFLRASSAEPVLIEAHVRSLREKISAIYTSNIRQYTSNIRQYTSNIRQYTSNIHQYTSNIRQYTSNIRQYTSNIFDSFAAILIVYIRVFFDRCVSAIAVAAKPPW